MSINSLFMSNKLTTERLEQVLKEHEIALKQFLEDLSISQPTYTHWGKRDVSRHMIPRIATHLQISMDELMGNASETKSIGLPPKILKAAKRLAQIPEQQKEHIIGLIEGFAQPKKNEAQPKLDTDRLGRIIEAIDQAGLDLSGKRRAEKIEQLYSNTALRTRNDFTAEIIKLSSRR